MKKTTFSISQTAEKYDKQGIQAAMTIAQNKIETLGLNDFDTADIRLTMNTTEITFSLESLPEEAD